ncbi:hypothetical protein EG832_16780, partial [bacterium]|nr:hypothetical protein [bacterium]
VGGKTNLCNFTPTTNLVYSFPVLDQWYIPNERVKINCTGWGRTQVPVYYSLTCKAKWWKKFGGTISLVAQLKNETASINPPINSKTVACGTGVRGDCSISISGQVLPSQINPNPNIGLHLYGYVRLVGLDAISTSSYEDCTWAFSLDPLDSILMDRSTLSNGSPKNGINDPRECPISACNPATASSGDPVDIRTGNFEYGWVDLSLQTPAGPLTMQRSYASQAIDTSTYPTTLGPGWTHNQEPRLFFEPGLVWLRAHTLNQYQFIDHGNHVYTPYPGVLAYLSYDSFSSTYSVHTTDQSLYEFDPNGKLLTWRNSENRGFDYTYTDGNLNRVTEPFTGRYIQFNYANGKLTSVTDHTNRQIDYGYDASGDLVSVTDTQDLTWSYAYSGHRMTEVKAPGFLTVLTVLYD